MEIQSKIKFTSYDRLFPNQDTMPKGGFGNLIALPLEGLASKNNNSEFVDDNFVIYPDQWAFLSTIQTSIVENVSVLKDAGIDVKLKSEFHQKFTIIYNTTIWYGSVNFLSFGSHEESIIRFENTDIATELLTSL